MDFYEEIVIKMPFAIENPVSTNIADKWKICKRMNNSESNKSLTY